MATANIADGVAALKTSVFTYKNNQLVLRTPLPFGVGDNQQMQAAADFCQRVTPSTVNA
jgi:hypothetical protein